jgi:lysozyme
MSTIRSRWTGKLHAREALLNRARRQVDYWARRAGTKHGADMLRARVALRTIREHQVAEARAVLARHPAAATGLSAEGLAFIAGREGFSAKPYRDSVGVLTIGYGETEGVRPGLVWTRAHALAQLKLRADRDYAAPVLATARAAGITLAQHELDALTSLVYNLGPGILAAGHTMGDAIRARDRRRIADAFLPYDKAGGRALLGLTLRRRAERAVFLQGA